MVSPAPAEEFQFIDGEGYPIFDEELAELIPPPGNAYVINAPPGCFGNDAGAIKSRAGLLTINTASFVTYAKVYEIMLVLEKDTRRAKAKIEITMTSVPAPIVSIECASLCFPTFGGVFINPTSRLAVRGACVEECGDEEYLWELQRPDWDWSNDKYKTTYCDPNVGPTTTTPDPTTTGSTSTTSTTTAPLVTENGKSSITVLQIFQ